MKNYDVIDQIKDMASISVLEMMKDYKLDSLILELLINAYMRGARDTSRLFTSTAKTK